MSGFSQEKPKILLAEDAIVNAMLIGDMLAQLGCDVDTVEDGRQAVDRALEKKYDLVFMDLQMPVMDGLTATGLILAAAGPDAAPVIVALSAADTQDQVDACLAAGMRDFVHKPVRSENLHAVLKKWLGHGQEAESGHTDLNVSGGQTPEFDSSFLDTLAAKTPEKAARFARMTQDNAASLVSEMDRALAADDAVGLVQAAHALKSVAGQVGAMALSEQARHIEMDGAAMTSARRHTALSCIHTLFDGLCVVLDGYTKVAAAR